MHLVTRKMQFHDAAGGSLTMLHPRIIPCLQQDGGCDMSRFVPLGQ